VAYPHPAIADCLRSTFGLVVYEEQILQICEAFAGLPGGRADMLRRGLVKDDARVVAEIAPEFAEAARRLGRTEEEALDYPLGLAYWHFAAYQEAQGNLKILNADEVEFLEWCEAQDRAAAGKKEVARDA